MSSLKLSDPRKWSYPYQGSSKEEIHDTLFIDSGGTKSDRIVAIGSRAYLWFQISARDLPELIERLQEMQYELNLERDAGSS